MAQNGVQYSNLKTEPSVANLPAGHIAIIWIAYGSGVTAGLMAIGHAAGIASTAGFSGWIAAASIPGCNLEGSLLCGWLSDKVSHRSTLTSLPLLGAAALLALSVLPAHTLTFLGIIAFAYGGTIATYPAAITNLFTGDDGPRAYARNFTAWGKAELMAPWLAGQMYDWYGTYTTALWVPAGLVILSAVTLQKAIQ